jgi:hypothetical protein
VVFVPEEAGTASAAWGELGDGFWANAVNGDTPVTTSATIRTERYGRMKVQLLGPCSHGSTPTAADNEHDRLGAGTFEFEDRSQNTC